MTARRICRKPIRLFLALALAALTLPLSAHAQFNNEYKNIYTGRTFNNPMSASLDTFVMHGMQKRMMYRSFLRKKGYTNDEMDRILRKSDKEVLAYMEKLKAVSDSPAATKTAAKATVKAANLVPATRFKSSGKRLLLNKAADALGTNTEEKAAYKTIFAEVAKAYEGEAKRLGFPNDIAGAMVFFADTAYRMHKPDAKPTGDAGTKALVHQLQVALDSDALRKSPAADKQKLYEYYLSLGAYLFTLSEVAKQEKDETAKAGAVKLGGEALRVLFKVDPSRISLTENGLEIAPE